MDTFPYKQTETGKNVTKNVSASCLPTFKLQLTTPSVRRRDLHFPDMFLLLVGGQFVALVDGQETDVLQSCGGVWAPVDVWIPVAEVKLGHSIVLFQLK